MCHYLTIFRNIYCFAEVPTLFSTILEYIPQSDLLIYALLLGNFKNVNSLTWIPGSDFTVYVYLYKNHVYRYFPSLAISWGVIWCILLHVASKRIVEGTLKFPHTWYQFYLGINLVIIFCRGGWGYSDRFFAHFLSYRLYYFAQVYWIILIYANRLLAWQSSLRFLFSSYPVSSKQQLWRHFCPIRIAPILGAILIPPQSCNEAMIHHNSMINIFTIETRTHLAQRGRTPCKRDT